MTETKPHFLLRRLHALNRSLWSPEADEMRYVSVLAVVTFLILPLWGHGHLKFMGPNPVMVAQVLAWILYLVLFGKRLRHRGELGHLIIGPTLFFAVLVFGVCLF
jgi:hypothetical protein